MLPHSSCAVEILQVQDVPVFVFKVNDLALEMGQIVP